MSHSITVTRTTTSTTSTAISLNIGVFKTASGLLKLFETIIGAVCLYQINKYLNYREGAGFTGISEYTMLFIVAFAFLLTTFLLLLSSLISLTAASVVPKTLFEFLYHLYAFIFYISASLALLVHLQGFWRTISYYEEKMTVMGLGLVNSALYSLSAILSFRSCRLR